MFDGRAAATTSVNRMKSCLRSLLSLSSLCTIDKVTRGDLTVDTKKQSSAAIAGSESLRSLTAVSTSTPKVVSAAERQDVPAQPSPVPPSASVSFGLEASPIRPSPNQSLRSALNAAADSPNRSLISLPPGTPPTSAFIVL